MKILAPVSSAQEAEILISEGADELYCGLGFEALSNKPGEKKQENDIWINRRNMGSANIRNLEALAQLVELAHRRGAKVFLTLNQPGYAQELHEEIMTFVREVRNNCKVDAFIIADPGLIRILMEKEPEIVIHVSSMAGILNSSAVIFFKNLGVKRIIFPRYLETKTLRKIIEAAGTEMEYEVFIFNDGCVFEEAHCNISHTFGGAFCHNPAWNYKLIQAGGKGNAGISGKTEAGKISGETFRQHLDEYKRWLWIGIKNFGGYSGTKYPLGMCGLCALPEYKEMGITSLKIIGREAPLRKKVRSVKLVKTILDYVKEGHTPEEVRQYAKAVKGARGLCETGYMCYDR